MNLMRLSYLLILSFVNYSIFLNYKDCKWGMDVVARAIDLMALKQSLVRVSSTLNLNTKRQKQTMDLLSLRRLRKAK